MHVCVGPSVHFMHAASSAGDHEMATSFTRTTRVGEPLSMQRDDRRVTFTMDGALQMKKINKKALIVSETMSGVTVGVWLQSAPHNSSSIGKTQLLHWCCQQNGFLTDTRTHVCRQRTCGSDCYHRNRPPFSSKLKWNQNRPFISLVKRTKHSLCPEEQTVN